MNEGDGLPAAFSQERGRSHSCLPGPAPASSSHVSLSFCRLALRKSLAAKTGGPPAHAPPWTDRDMGVGWVSEQNGGSFRKGDEDTRSCDDPGSRLSMWLAEFRCVPGLGL